MISSTACQADEFAIAAIDVTGDDSEAFLHGQLTQDLAGMQTGEQRFAAWVNPAGRVISLTDVQSIEGGFRLIVPAGLRDDLLTRLGRFVFRSRVTLEAGPDDAVDKLFPATPDAGARHLARLRAGVVWIGRETSERFTAHQLNLDLIGAISLNKGCYSGQEIIARTHNLGRVKRRIQRLTAEGREPAAAGSAVVAEGVKRGEIVDVAGHGPNGFDALVLLPLGEPIPGLALEDGSALAYGSLPYELPNPDSGRM